MSSGEAPGPGPDRGVVFAATGPEKYAALAARAAETLRRTNPGLAVDLFTDAPRDLDVFDRIHVREDAWARTKIEALRYSRFERTLYLDSDIVVLADIGDMFDVLDRFDIALAHDQLRNSERSQTMYEHVFPNAYPQFNGGVICLRANAATAAMLAEWKSATQAQGTGRDQPSLREVLWNSDLRIATLPPEFNLMRTDMLRTWSPARPAPRILHSPRFHRLSDRFLASDTPAAELLGLRIGSKLPFMLGFDNDLARRTGRTPTLVTKTNRRPSIKVQRERLAWALPRLPRRLAILIKAPVGRLLRRAGLR